jgi:hypothetical protein
MLVSGHYFKEQCRWNFDGRYPLRIWAFGIEVRRGDQVFMKVSDIPEFVRKIRLVMKKVVAVIHNSDESFTNEMYSTIEPYVERVYAVNNICQRAISIPLGLRDHQYISHHVVKKIASDPEQPRTIKLLVNFLIATNPSIRQPVFDKFKDQSFCTVQDYVNYDYGKSLMHSDSETMTKRAEFYNTLKISKFVLCPQGTGLDTHRVYECILFGAIPIVISSHLNPIYQRLPVFIVDSWDDVTEQKLDECSIQPNPAAITNFQLQLV